MTEPYYIVVGSGDPFDRDLGGTPTPALVEAGRGDAFQKGYLPSGVPVDGSIWYLRDDKRGYRAEKYRNVRVIRNPRYVGYPG